MMIYWQNNRGGAPGRAQVFHGGGFIQQGLVSAPVTSTAGLTFMPGIVYVNEWRPVRGTVWRPRINVEYREVHSQ